MELSVTRLDTLFVAGCDPYRVAASVLLDKPSEAVSQNDRDIVKRVFMHVAARRAEFTRAERETPLRQAADMFHEIGAAYEARRLLDREEHKMPQAMYDSITGKLRTPAVLTKIAAEGFELCVRALAEMGATDVTIHECGKQALGEAPWGENVD